MDAPLPPIPDTPAARQPALEAALEALRASDPGFDEPALLDSLRKRFLRVKARLQARSPEGLGGEAAPALVQHWKQQAAQQLVSGVRVELRGLEVDEVRPVWLTLGPVQDRLTAAIDYRAASTGVDDQSGQVLFGGEPDATTEYWTLARPSGTRTPAPDAARAGCPTCGAPVDPESGAACPYCGGALPGVLLGWVLARVDDEIEWAPESLK